MPSGEREPQPMETAAAENGRTMRHSRMNVRHLEIFWAVMRSGNQHEAARLLGLSQPAVSKLLRYTEGRVGVALFRRIKGRLHPTAEGEVFFRAVDDIFRRLEATERLARDLQRRITGRVTLTTNAAFNAAYLPAVVGKFLAAYPMVKIGLKVLTPAQTVQRVANGEADLGLAFGPVDPDAVDVHMLRQVPLICAVPRRHRLATKSTLTVADLRGERLVTATERPLWSKLLTEAFAARGLLPEVAVECTQPDVAIAMAEVNAGIAVGPKVPLRRDTALDVVFRPLQPRISVPVLAVTPRGHALPQAVEALIDQLKITAEELF